MDGKDLGCSETAHEDISDQPAHRIQEVSAAETRKLLGSLRQGTIPQIALQIFANTTSVRQSTTNYNEFWINLWTVENGAEIADWLENQPYHFTLEIGAANFLVVLHFKDSDAAMMFKMAFF